MTKAQIEYLRLGFLLETDSWVQMEAGSENFSRYNDFYLPKFRKIGELMTPEELKEVEEVARQVFEGR